MRNYLLSTALFAGITVALTACSGVAVKPLQSDADRLATAYPGTTLAELEEGRALYKANCGSCHGLIKPSALPEEKWKKMVHVMAPKAKLGEVEEGKILKYVLAVREQTAK
jgi:cytochrome c5